MNLIGNCCISNYLEDRYGLGRTNPFSWVDVDFKSVFNMITGWERINWGNFKLSVVAHPYFKGEREFLITVDKKVIIRYVHYLLDRKYPTPTTVGTNIRYSRIWEFIVEKYTERVKKMLDSHEYPSFILEWKHLDFRERAWAQISDIDTDLKIAIISRGAHLKTTRSNILIIDEPENKFPKWYANKHGDQIKTFLEA